MKAAPFDYHAPETVAEAAGLLAEHGDEAKVLAGGQSLLPMLALRLTRFEHLVDVNGVTEMHGITRTDGHLRIGAATPQAVAEHDAGLARRGPAARPGHPPHRSLPDPQPGDRRRLARPRRSRVGAARRWRWRSTPRSRSPSARATRDIPAAEFFTGTWSTALADDEILVGHPFPVWSGRSGFGVHRGRPPQRRLRPRRAWLRPSSSTATTASPGSRSGCSAWAPRPCGPPPTEAALVGAAAFRRATLPTRPRAGAAALDSVDDVHATAAYRTRVAAHLMETALLAAIEEARRG